MQGKQERNEMKEKKMMIILAGPVGSVLLSVNGDVSGGI